MCTTQLVDHREWRLNAIDALNLGNVTNRVLSSNAQKCIRKARFYKPSTSAASESEFDHAHHIQHPKSRCASLCSVKVIKMWRLAINHLLFYSRFTGRFVVAKPWNRLHRFSVLRHVKHWERTTSMHPKLIAVFNHACLFVWWRLKSFICIHEITWIHLLWTMRAHMPCFNIQYTG